MSWASKRETTKVEDLAYCLMGIFSVNMPLLYGEGEKAFTRLQEEIIKTNYDHSLFVWKHNFSNDAYGSHTQAQRTCMKETPEGIGVLAPHPSAFHKCTDIIPFGAKSAPYAMTNRGLEIQLPVLCQTLPEKPFSHLAILSCRSRNSHSKGLAIPIKSLFSAAAPELANEFFRVPDEDPVNIDFSRIAESQTRKIYLLRTGPIWSSRTPRSFYRCQIRGYERELGVQLIKFRCGPYLIPSSGHTDEYYGCEEEQLDRPMAREKDWGGIQGAFYFSKFNGPAFVVVFIWVDFKNRKRWPGIYVRVKPVHDKMQSSRSAAARQVSLREVLKEYYDLPFRNGRELHEAHATMPFEGRVMKARVGRDEVGDEEVFVLSLSLWGLKRKRQKLVDSDDDA
ncbi:hypothetical protein P154DRAFT_457426 [Amniculicola lignicola CBS 123094]|uniref:DUF8212 domain-containing protein n=1 Tax=Amniculicola lignicola CBS 123094 TaxID=1392246 RepID=A0A6A5WZ48_9PLEO|nr:hypothetical protein P154DRAFT_457426 [Amniculicola lignicola CBS 123094]